jgi:hypothetical protein
VGELVLGAIQKAMRKDDNPPFFKRTEDSYLIRFELVEPLSPSRRYFRYRSASSPSILSTASGSSVFGSCSVACIIFRA